MYRRYRNSKPQPRTIVAKFAGTCHCCGGPIDAGEVVAWYPAGTAGNNAKGVIAHVGGLDGTSAKCSANIAGGYADPGELAEDRWNEQYR